MGAPSSFLEHVELVPRCGPSWLPAVGKGLGDGEDALMPLVSCFWIERLDGGAGAGAHLDELLGQTLP